MNTHKITNFASWQNIAAPGRASAGADRRKQAAEAGLAPHWRQKQPAETGLAPHCRNTKQKQQKI